jgi:hypothetical protein
MRSSFVVDTEVTPIGTHRRLETNWGFTYVAVLTDSQIIIDEELLSFST